MAKTRDIEAKPCCNLGDVVGLRAAQRRDIADQLSDRHLQRRRELWDEADMTQHLGAVVPRVATDEADVAVARVLAQQAANQCGLAGAVGTDQGYTLAACDLQVEALQDVAPAEAFAQIADLDHKAFSRASSTRRTRS